LNTTYQGFGDTGAERSVAAFTMEDHLSASVDDAAISQIIAGLRSPRKQISSIYFYDGVGSKLFEQITRLPEYYPTRTEKSILRHVAPVIIGAADHLEIVEIGSGDCSKISILLNAIPPQRRETTRYTPVDVSPDAIQESASLLQQTFPGIKIRGIVGDFTRQMHLIPSGKNQLFCFFGGTIGNLSGEQKERFLNDLSRIMRPGDALLLGADMVKPVRILEKAYNDSQGVTAAFNRNILKAVNRLAGTDFNPLAFDHLAFYNRRRKRIEMHLKARSAMRISCPAIPEKIEIDRGESIHTENSHKYTLADLSNSAAAAGLRLDHVFMDENRWFTLAYFLKE
jgi:L-histidine N-alpha-methyltransferase